MGTCQSTKNNSLHSNQNINNSVKISAPSNKDLKRVSTLSRKETISNNTVARKKVIVEKKVAEVFNSGQNELKQKAELSISLENISDAESTYFAKLRVKNPDGWSTEFISTSSLSGERIDFQETLIFDYLFEKEQMLEIQIFRNDSMIENDSSSSVGRLMGSKQSTLTINFNDFDLVLTANNASGFDVCYTFKVQLEQHEFSKYQNIYYSISNFNNMRNWALAYRSEELHEHEYKFENINLGANACNNGIPDNKIRFEFSDYEEGEIGYIDCSISEIKSSRKFQLINTIGNHMNFHVTIFALIEENLKFIDLLKMGMQINFSIGVDFTQSNKDPFLPDSLHSTVTPEPNCYERVICSCGKVLAYYDYDQQFPFFGFGAKINSFEPVNHCFAVNQRENDPEINGIDEVIKAYKTSFSYIQLYGPTYFSPLINRINTMVKEKLLQGANKDYMILMIITDGIINDMTQTIDSIVESAKLPISIVIVGVGNADFTNMELLDGDDIPLKNSKNEIRLRDIVQFVPFSKFEGNAQKLSEEVLAEIPRQIEEYYRYNKLKLE